MASHPLEAKIGRVEKTSQPLSDQTPSDFPGRFLPSRSETVKRTIGTLVYPIKNRLQRPRVEAMLQQIGIEPISTPKPNVICYGDKGFGFEIFLATLARVIGRPPSILCFGCGLGKEAITISQQLRPRSLVGIDYFNYERAWSYTQSIIKSRFGVEAQFLQADLRDPGAFRSLPQFDLIISSAVLEHLQDMDENFVLLKQLLKPGGHFASIWGPMWHSYSGDHIAAEVGFDAGFEHVRLSTDDYIKFYTSHPRNRETVARGEPTWLELGLHNFRRYDEYIADIQATFGEIKWLTWKLSPEAFQWRSRHLEKWNQILATHPQITALDLALNSAAVIASEA